MGVRIVIAASAEGFVDGYGICDAGHVFGCLERFNEAGVYGGGLALTREDVVFFCFLAGFF